RVGGPMRIENSGSHRRPRVRPSWAAAAVAIGVVHSFGDAHASEIDEDKGAVVLSSDAIGVSFDGPQTPDGVTLILNHKPGNGVDLARKMSKEGVPLEGTGSLVMGGEATPLILALTDLDALAGRRLELTVWQKPMGTDVTGWLVWSADMIGLVTLVPTGRATD